MASDTAITASERLSSSLSATRMTRRLQVVGDPAMRGAHQLDLAATPREPSIEVGAQLAGVDHVDGMLAHQLDDAIHHAFVHATAVDDAVRADAALARPRDQRMHHRFVRHERGDVELDAPGIDVRTGLEDGAPGTVDPLRVAKMQDLERHCGRRVGSQTSSRSPLSQRSSACSAARFTSRKNAARRTSPTRSAIAGANNPSVAAPYAATCA